MMFNERLVNLLPGRMRNQVAQWFEAAELLVEMRDPKVLAAIGPAGLRGLLLQRGKQGVPTLMPAKHQVHFDWQYPHDHEEMATLYRRAKEGQWNGDSLPWHIDVDPLNPEVPLIPPDFIDGEKLASFGVRLDAAEQVNLRYSLAAWMLSQFLHGEQGALFAAAPVTEAVQFFDGKLNGRTQGRDRGRHA